ncbi:MAG: putative Ig domain-containing protein, partial [Bryobacterales bacterium]|nr:putative Ig domain-containing protein [Bryobacterales bacterium]
MCGRAVYTRVFFAIIACTTPAWAGLTITTGSNLGTLALGENQIPLQATGGSGPLTWSVVTGSMLPAGFAIRTDVPSFFPTGTAAGLIGVATTPETYNFSLQVSDSATTVSQPFTLTITDLNLKDGYPLPDAFVSSAYSYQLTAFNNTGPVSATFAGCGSPSPTGLPPGMSLNTTSTPGLISGTPTAAGNYNVNFSISYAGQTVGRGVGINVYAVQFTNAVTSTGSLPNANQGASYTYGLTASSAAGGPYTFSGCCLPPGLSLSPAGTISGTVTGGVTKYNFNVTVTDSASNSYTENMSIDVAPPSGVGVPEPQILPYGNLDNCTIGMTCIHGIGVYNGGTAPFTWTVTGLPAGMDYISGRANTLSWISPGDVELWGAPGQGTLGPHTITVTVTDVNGLVSNQTFTLNVVPLFLDPGGMPNGMEGVSYTWTFRVVGGVPPYTAAEIPGFSFPGRLPSGLNLSVLTVSGTPNEDGGFNQLFKFTDSASVTPNTLEITQYPNFASVSGGNITVNMYQTLYAIQGRPYAFQLGACCVSSYTWSSVGTLPPGITLSSSGQLSGAPMANGTYTFLVTAVQAGVPSNFANRLITFVVTPISNNTSSTLPYGNQGAAYSQ